MKTVLNKATLLLVLSMFIFISCGDDDEVVIPPVINDAETITTVKLTATRSGSSVSETFTWTEDSQDDITLYANSTYNFKIQFLDESDPNDVEDITEEVIAEKDEHFVFYQTTVDGVTFASASDDEIDTDSVGINISSDWTTTGAATGLIKAFLIHEPTTKTGTERDDFGGSTDVEVTFNVTTIVPVAL